MFEFSENYFIETVKKLKLEQNQISKSTIEELTDYIYRKKPPEQFLTAVLENDLFRTVSLADKNNKRVIPLIVFALYNYAPSQCWGNREKVQNWIKR